MRSDNSINVRWWKPEDYVQIKASESHTWCACGLFIFEYDVLILANDVHTILACGTRCDKFINACLSLQKWKIMPKLGQMSHIHDVHAMFCFQTKCNYFC